MKKKEYSFETKVIAIGILAISIELLESNNNDANKARLEIKNAINDLVQENSKDLYHIFKDIKS